MLKTTYNRAKAELDVLWKRVTSDGEIVIITRPNCENVALVPADVLTGLMETLHLLRSPANAERLLSALERAQKTEDKTIRKNVLNDENSAQP